ncbi:unnamed protein product [Durusdinium trenchii]|uniref:tRNA/rRNA methyltransferase SpoU type domain-containing protein n=1 Tax=Durusdinium trenchii TaxID=1381693 RepID=A0ABP0N3C2_9DINO
MHAPVPSAPSAPGSDAAPVRPAWLDVRKWRCRRRVDHAALLVAAKCGGCVWKRRSLRMKAVATITDPADPRVVLYRVKEHRNQRQYGEQIRKLAKADRREQLRRLQSIVAVHYGKDCLERLKAQGSASTAVVSIVIMQGASAELMMLAQKVCETCSGDLFLLAPNLVDEFCMDLAWGEPVRYAVTWPRSSELYMMPPPFLVLDGLVSAQNLGQVVRSAVLLGIKSIILSRPTFNCLNGRACHASQGWLYYAEYFLAEDLPTSLKELQTLGICVYAAEESHPRMVSPHPDPRWALVVGNEERGVSEEVLRCCNDFLRVPQVRGASLNVAHAAAICIYELAQPSTATVLGKMRALACACTHRGKEREREGERGRHWLKLFWLLHVSRIFGGVH